MNLRNGLAAVGLLCLLAAGLLLGGELYLTAKGALAHVLIDRSFRKTLEDGKPHRPWSWADMVPVAVLEAPDQGVRRTVLSGAAGESMAFGVGHISGTAMPNGPGNCVLAGHRDGDFAFLAGLTKDDRIVVRTAATTRTYKVVSTRVVDAGDYQVLAGGSSDRLTLVTCWPFRSLLRSSRRYVVACAPAEL
jgi:sortase A